MSVKCVLLPVVLTLCPVGAQARLQTFTLFLTGNDLLAACSAPTGTFPVGQCLGYIQGVVDAASVSQRLCLPHTVNAGQMRDIVVAYLRQHPENRHLAASNFVEIAMGQFFACGAKP
jgi:hypothetical protein